MIWILIAAFLFAALATMGLVVSARRHSRWSADDDLSGPQKMHVKAVPRVGGIGIFAGVSGGGMVTMWLHPELGRPVLLLLACMLPAFLSGIWEDFTKAISPRRRMLALAFSGLMGVLLLKGVIVRTGWVGFDRLLEAGGLLWLGSVGAVFAVTGISNSVNIIDGMNGLASMCVAFSSCALACVAWRVQDDFVCGLAVATLGASLGFFVWNYPRGLVFLGDGGAYLLGFILAELGILLSARHPEVSMLAPLLIVAYPVFETLFTMYRRRFIQKRPMTQPDGMHLHTLIYRRLMRGTVDAHGVAAPIQGNSRTSPYLWMLSLVAVLPSMIWWNDTPALAIVLLVFVCAYLTLYRRIATFRTPTWMVARQGRQRHRAALTKP